jgi:hypothetical protein
LTSFQTVEVVREPTQRERLLIDRHGVRIVFKQTGQIGRFDFPTLLLSLVSGLALISIASLILDYTIKWLGLCDDFVALALYRREKFIESAEWYPTPSFETIGERDPVSDGTCTPESLDREIEIDPTHPTP